MSKQTKAFSADVTVENGKREVSAVITTSVVDRDREVVVPQGVNAKQYMTNPVVLYNHTYGGGSTPTAEKLPVGHCVALKRTDTGIQFKMKFAERPATLPENQPWLPDTLLSLYQQGTMRAFSIGFDPTETRPPTNKDVETYGGEVRRVISKSMLYEVSCVALPANQDAVAVAVSKGLITADQAKEMFGDGMEQLDADLKEVAARLMEKAHAEAEADLPEKHVVTLVPAPEPQTEVRRAVVKTITLPEPPAPVAPVKCVHRVIRPRSPNADATVKRLVVAEVAKKTGKLYAD